MLPGGLSLNVTPWAKIKNDIVAQVRIGFQSLKNILTCPLMGRSMEIPRAFFLLKITHHLHKVV